MKLEDKAIERMIKFNTSCAIMRTKNKLLNLYEGRFYEIMPIYEKQLEVLDLTNEEHFALLNLCLIQHWIKSANTEELFIADSSENSFFYRLFQYLDDSLKDKLPAQFDYVSFYEFPNSDDYYHDFNNARQDYEDYDDWFENSNAWKIFDNNLASFLLQVDLYLLRVDNKFDTNYIDIRNALIDGDYNE